MLTDDNGILGTHSNAILAGTIGLAVGAGVGAVAGYAVGKKRRKSSSKRRSYNKARKKSRIRHKKYTPRTAGKGKDRSTRRIRYTKKGQPYIILKSGKARFIKMSSAQRSHKQKGGRY